MPATKKKPAKARKTSQDKKIADLEKKLKRFEDNDKFVDELLDAWEKIASESLDLAAREPRKVGSEKDRRIWALSHAVRELQNASPDQARVYLSGGYEDRYLEEHGENIGDGSYSVGRG